MPGAIGHCEPGPSNLTRVPRRGSDCHAVVRTRKKPVANVAHGRDGVLACLLVREAVYTGGVARLDDLMG